MKKLGIFLVCAFALCVRAQTTAANSAALAEVIARAEKGDAASQYLLGVKYRKGEDVSENKVEAYKWFHLAAGAGHAQAVGPRFDLGSSMTQAEISMAKQLAEAFLKGERPPPAGTPFVRRRKAEVNLEGFMANNVLKYVYKMTFKGDVGDMNGKPATVDCVISADNYVSERNAGDRALIANGGPLKVDGKIFHLEKDGSTNATTLSGILLPENRDILSGWLVSTNSPLPPTDLWKLDDSLRKQIATNVVTAAFALVPGRLWLFKFGEDRSLSFQP